MRAWLGIAIALAGCKRVDDSNWVTGEFSANHPELGTWTVRPSSCEDGREYGFQGVLIRFALPAAGPVTPEAPVPVAPSRTPATGPEEIRIDVARAGDNVIELRYPDRDGTVRRIRERECASITGSFQRTERGAGEPVKVHGHGVLDCPAFGLRAKFEVAGCLPPGR